MVGQSGSWVVSSIWVSTTCNTFVSLSYVFPLHTSVLLLNDSYYVCSRGTSRVLWGDSLLCCSNLLRVSWDTTRLCSHWVMYSSLVNLIWRSLVVLLVVTPSLCFNTFLALVFNSIFLHSKLKEPEPMYARCTLESPAVSLCDMFGMSKVDHVPLRKSTEMCMLRYVPIACMQISPAGMCWFFLMLTSHCARLSLLWLR